MCARTRGRNAHQLARLATLRRSPPWAWEPTLLTRSGAQVGLEPSPIAQSPFASDDARGGPHLGLCSSPARPTAHPVEPPRTPDRAMAAAAPAAAAAAIETRPPYPKGQALRPAHSGAGRRSVGWPVDFATGRTWVATRAGPLVLGRDVVATFSTTAPAAPPLRSRRAGGRRQARAGGRGRQRGPGGRGRRVRGAGPAAPRAPRAGRRGRRVRHERRAVRLAGVAHVAGRKLAASFQPWAAAKLAAGRRRGPQPWAVGAAGPRSIVARRRAGPRASAGRLGAARPAGGPG
jgi:hypothetical protein